MRLFAQARSTAGLCAANMLSVPQIFFCRLDVSTKVSILFPFLRIGHVIEYRFFFELEKTIKRFLADFERKNQVALATDSERFLTYLAQSDWMLRFFMEKWPDIELHKTRENI